MGKGGMTLQGFRTMRRLAAWLCLAVSFAAPFCASAAAEGTEQAGESGAVRPEKTAAWWCSRYAAADAEVLDEAGIAALNERISRASDVWTGAVTTERLASFAELDGAALRRRLAERRPLRRKAYLEGRRMTKADAARFRANLNLDAVPDTVTGRFAVTTAHTSLRSLPTDEGLYDSASPDARYYDNVQDSVLDAGEPVVVWHTSRDRRYVFLRSRTLSGWVACEDVAYCPRADWNRYAAPQQFLTVAGRDLYPAEPGGTWHGTGPRPGYAYGADPASFRGMMLQGSALLYTRFVPAADGAQWEVLLPQRDAAGALTGKKMLLPSGPALRKGYAPYTARQVLDNAMQFLDSVYGWGGDYGSVDCSSFVDAVYRAEGICLPRNSGQIRKAPLHTVSLEGLGTAERLAVLAQLPPGALLHLPGHVMIYLGLQDGVPYAIHSFSSHYVNGKKVYERRVAVTDLLLRRSSGRTFLDELICCQEVR